MAANQPLSFTTILGKFRTEGLNLANLRLAGQVLLRTILGLPTVALAALAIMFFAWSCQHHTRLREAAGAKQVEKHAAVEISQLQQQVAGALRNADQSAQAVRQLEAQRQQLAREAEGLRQSLASLRQQESARVDEVANLSTSEVVARVASRLGTQDTGPEDSTLDSPSSTLQGSAAKGPQPKVLNPNSGGSQPPAPSPALVLSGQGARKVETTFVELDSCQQQNQVLGQQVTNCEQQSKLSSAVIDQQAATITKLNTALADKDQILAQTEAAHRAELIAARGTWRSRFFRAAEYFAGGFVAGVLVR